MANVSQDRGRPNRGGIKIAELAIEVSERTLGKDRRHAETFSFASWEETRADAELRIAERSRAGYAEVPLEEYQRAPARGGGAPRVGFLRRRRATFS